MADKKKVQKTEEVMNFTDTKKWASQYDDSSPPAIAVPEGMSVFRPKEAKVYQLDFIAFKVGKGNPKADEGSWHFERTYMIHKNVGPRKRKVVCLKENFGKPCPVCEEVAKARRSGVSEAVLKEQEPKVQQAFLVRDRQNKEAGLQLFDSAHYKSFGALLKTELESADEDSPIHKFFHPKGGRTLKVRFVKDSFASDGGSITYLRADKIETAERNDLDMKLYKTAPCLDDLVEQGALEYDELMDLFLATPKKGQEDKPADGKKDKKADKKKKPKDDEEVEEEIEEEEEADDDSEADSDEDADSGDSEDEEESEESEDTDDSEEETEDDSDEESEEVELEPKDEVEWEVSKGGKGIVKEVKKGVATVKVTEGKSKGKTLQLRLEDLTKLIEEEEVEEEAEEEDDSPFPEEDEDDAASEDTEDDDLDMEDDGPSFDDEEEVEEEEEKKPKKKVKKVEEPAPTKKKKVVKK
jgi:hypothetical protein